METDEVLNPKGDSVLELDKILDILNYDDSLNHLYDENSKYEVQQALTSMGFEELISTFEVEKIDYTVFISMDDQFIYGILKRFPWGIRKKFAIEYEKWLKNQNDQQMSVCHSSSRNNQKIDEESLSLMFREDPEAKEFYEL
ncbi:hypothetical protein PVAND_000204 [Polypedilum vanderplanki]|uniref:Uncharacterized protein n=1 Tax=Polypedilum vanderplanki TaxID=319348 RepID=A0A9J6BJL2_POLVA|nr:hypothetical protein PVAND_000204 [Polypedilum vanderplanki]